MMAYLFEFMQESNFHQSEFITHHSYIVIWQNMTDRAHILKLTRGLSDNTERSNQICGKQRRCKQGSQLSDTVRYFQEVALNGQFSSKRTKLQPDKQLLMLRKPAWLAGQEDAHFLLGKELSWSQCSKIPLLHLLHLIYVAICWRMKSMFIYSSTWKSSLTIQRLAILTCKM